MFRRRLLQLHRQASFPVLEYGPDHFVITPRIIGQLRELPYREQWKLALAEGWFHVRMEDHSLFIFNDSVDTASFSFLEAPLLMETWRDFLSARGVQYSKRAREEHAEEYQLVWETARLKEHITPIRYDLDQVGYRCGAHPVAHIHVGLANQIRIGLRRRMSLESFSLFVMRQMYPESWLRLVEQAGEPQVKRLVRGSLPLIDVPFWASKDEIELHLA